MVYDSSQNEKSPEQVRPEMPRPPKRRPLLALLTVAALWTSAPAAAFELFGVRLWGEAEEPKAGFEVIDPLPFAVTFAVRGGSDDLKAALENASSLWGGQDTPASGVGGLIAQSRGDYRRILAALYANAYYGGEVSILLAGREAAGLTLDSPMPAEVPVVISVRTGPRFRFGVASIVNPPPTEVGENDRVEDPVGDAFRPGERADAGVIAAASATAIERWRQVGHAKAFEADRSIVAEHPTSRLDAIITLDPGRSADFGRTRVAGTRRVDPGFVAYMADLPEGKSFDPDRIRAAEDRLTRLGVFRSVRIVEADAIAPDGTLDMTIEVEERRPRTVGFGGTLSTIDGLGVEAFWEHRNLFGRAERVRFSASVTGLGVTGDTGDFDYKLAADFLKPGVLNPNAAFVASVVGQRLDVDTYREESIAASAGLQRSFARNLNGELRVFVKKARFTDDAFGVRDFLMFGPVARGDYDRRDDVLDPTRGYFAATEITPFYEAEFGNAAARGTLEGRVYRGLGPEARVVLAARAKVGSYVGPSERESPPDQLFFAGGAGSVRGYAYQSIGVDFRKPNGNVVTVGGRSLVEASGEVRFRVGQRFGGVGFVDAGYVGATSDFVDVADGDLRVGAGAGLRYFTGLGPLRLDVAAPVNRRNGDDVAAFYVGIGQAF
jgi:translocation and assembly module TamA